MKKLLIGILGLLTLVAASSFATETRTMVMGDNHMIMVDDANMFTFPGRVNNYPNLALGEFADNDMYNFGVTWQFNEENPWVLGTFVSYSPQSGPYDYWGSDMAQFPNYYWYELAPGNGEQLSTSYPRRMQILYGRKLGGNNFGFSLDATRASWEAKEDSGAVLDQSVNPKQSFHEYTFAFGLTEGTSGKWDIALAYTLGGWTNENVDGEKITEPNGYYDIMAGGRYFWVQNPKVTLVPHLSATMGKRGVNDLNDPASNDDTYTSKYSLTAFELGMGMNYTPAPNILAVMDLGMTFSAVKAEYSGGSAVPAAWKGEEKETYFAFPYMRIGFEGQVFNWMDVRAGGRTVLWTNADKWESDFEVDQTWNTPSTSTYFGFGFNWGKLYLDTYTDPELLLKGLDFISGSGNNDGSYNMNWQVSMVYEMF